MLLLTNSNDFYKASKIADEVDAYNSCCETKALQGFCNLSSAREDRE